MGALFSAVIPGFVKEFADGDTAFMEGNEPSGAKAVVGLRINDITTGAILSVDINSTAIAFDGCAVGEEIAGRFTAINAASTVDSIHVYYV